MELEGRMFGGGGFDGSIPNVAGNGDPNNASLGVTWPVWPATLVFDATPTAKAISGPVGAREAARRHAARATKRGGRAAHASSPTC